MTVVRWWWRFRRPKLEKLIKAVDPAEKVELQSPDERVIPALANTEERKAWAFLRRHATRGQIDPRVLKVMRWADLQYLAGMQQPNPIEMAAKPDEPEQKTRARIRGEVKVVENAVRAERELIRRLNVRAMVWASFVGGAAGGVIVAVID